MELLTIVGNDDAGRRVLDYAKENHINIDKITMKDDLTTGMNLVLVDEKGERYFLTNPQSSLRKLSEEEILPYTDSMADIVSFASIFVSPPLDIDTMERVFQKIKEKPERILAADMTKAKNGEKLKDLEKILQQKNMTI